MGSGMLLKHAIQKYGIDNFRKEIIAQCSSEEEMDRLEEELVSLEFTLRADTYNIRIGGAGWVPYLINQESPERS
jgi:hypothetical protein